MQPTACWQLLEILRPARQQRADRAGSWVSIGVCSALFSPWGVTQTPVYPPPQLRFCPTFCGSPWEVKGSLLWSHCGPNIFTEVVLSYLGAFIIQSVPTRHFVWWPGCRTLKNFVREVDIRERLAQVNKTTHKIQNATKLKKQGYSSVLEVWKWWWWELKAT